MNYREEIRKAIECYQFGNKNYGEWGALNLEQRKDIKRLLDELDNADNCVKELYFKNRKQKEVIDRIQKIINTEIKLMGYAVNDSCLILIQDVLKEVSEWTI